jgi:6-phosphogluconolactonase
VTREDTGTEPELVVVTDREAVAAAAAEQIAAALSEAVSARGAAHWATTGGSMAPAIYRHLAEPPLREAVPWGAVHVWWGDDRYVPRDHPLSNVKPLDDILLAIGWTQGGQLALGQSGEAVPVPLPIDHLHPFPTTAAIAHARGAGWCAASLGEELASAELDQDGPWPVLDLVVLGVGGDGHVLSVFPGSAALTSDAIALAVPSPTHFEPNVERVTLNPGIIGAARRVLVVAAGAEKATMLADVLGEGRDASRWPAQLARRAGATWIVDTSAGAALPR